ncbi:PREDICTED: OX-2 membrane glycoprotein-like, partial [Cyprinodon variegatus]|uniref:OX-2 membrane glycoprotein-like n=1 Tax=Cyprinodon variegatus TaxID=28743 RepID=UPI000742C5CC
MRPAVIISCFLVNAILQTGQLALIETKETVWAAVGDQASLSCQLIEDKDVLQITWQKVLPYAEKNLATYTKKYGYSVRVDLAEKMDFQCEDLQSCSMVIRKVMEEDEGCYRCLFITYRTGILIARTCLRLYELYDPVLDVSRSKSPAESVVSCSATGRPAPTVTLTVLQQNLSFSHYNSSSVTHSNGTVTVTTTALLSASSSTQVGCSVSVLSAAPREKLITVPGVKGTSDDGFDVESASNNSAVAWCIISGFMVCIVAFLIILWFTKRAEKRYFFHTVSELSPGCSTQQIIVCQFALIETVETVWAAVGDQASLSCQLTEDKDVLKITWQKVRHNEQKSLASYTKDYGYRVRLDLKDKMDFLCEDLQSCSMVIRKVMEEDEGCYQCLFSTYPRGILIVRTCLRLYGEERRHAAKDIISVHWPITPPSVGKIVRLDEPRLKTPVIQTLDTIYSALNSAN